MTYRLPSPVRNSAKRFVDFLNQSVTPFHAVESCVTLLQNAGFQEILEKDLIDTAPGKKYFMKKNHSSIFAFAVGGAYEPANGFSIVVAHTDSPCLRVKPISKRCSNKFLQVGISTYGGGLWRTWFDRDLCVAGQVIFKRNDKICHKLINVNRPILHIPSLAIHLDDDRSNFNPNKETHLLPIFATTKDFTTLGECGVKNAVDIEQNTCSIIQDHHDEFLNLVAAEAGCAPEELLDMDLYLYDAQPAALTGLREEFISGSRLDNLVGVYTAISALINTDLSAFDNDPNIRMVACFDNEEVGSASAQGAESSITEWLLRRICGMSRDGTTFERAIGKSFLISADQAHAAHPNYAQKHEDNHRPAFHEGVVVKVNVNQRYATTAITHAVLKVIAERVGVPLQKVVVRNDSLCGSTVGPLLSKKLGIQTIDVGCPQLAMHSIREFGDVSSIHQATKLFSGFFDHLPHVIDNIQNCNDNASSL